MTEKQSQARNLFFQTDLGKTKIADILSVSRRTLHYWIKTNNWENQKRSAENMPSLIAENVYHLINRFTMQLMGEDRILRPVTYKEADTLHKLTLTVNKLKKGATNNETMEMFGLFMEFVNKRSPGMAQQIMPLVDDYIASRSDRHAVQFRPDHFNDMGLIPQKQEDTEEIKRDLEDLIAWADGEPFPVDEEAETAAEHAAGRAEPLPKKEVPANQASVNYADALAQNLETASPEQIEALDRMWNEMMESRNRRLKEKDEDHKFYAELHGFPYKPLNNQPPQPNSDLDNAA